MAHYDINTLGAAVKAGKLVDGDTYLAFPGTTSQRDHWTYVGGKWVKTISLQPQQAVAVVPPTIPPGPGPMRSIWGQVGNAHSILGDKLPPMTCSEGCGFTNEYVGKEHLINGLYVCRQCRPRYERRQRTLALKATNEEAAGDPFAYGPSWKDGVGGL